MSCPRWSRTTAGDVSDRYASVTTPDSREGGSRTRGLVLPRHARHRSSSSRIASLRCSDPCGIRTQPLQLERLTTSPEVERAVLICARTLSAVGREALESSSAAFQATAKPSQLPTQSFVAGFPPSADKKSPMSLRHRAFISRQTVFRPSVTSAKDAAGYFVGTAAYPHWGRTRLCPRNNPPLCILGSNLVVKTSLKEQPEQACQIWDRTPTWPRPLYTP